MTHPARIGRPARAEALSRHQAGLDGLDYPGEPRAPNAPPPVWGTWQTTFAEAGGDFLMFSAMFFYLRFLPFRCLGAGLLPAEIRSRGVF